MSESNRTPTKAEIHELIDERLQLAASEIGHAAAMMMIGLFASPPSKDTDAMYRSIRCVEATSAALTGKFDTKFAEEFVAAIRFYAGK